MPALDEGHLTARAFSMRSQTGVTRSSCSAKTTNRQDDDSGVNEMSKTSPVVADHRPVFCKSIELAPSVDDPRRLIFIAPGLRFDTLAR
jgi:hypothetical protein